jgi:subtilisin family serine protease
MKQTTFGGCFIFLITKYSPILTSLMKRLISRSSGKLLFLFFMAAAIPWLLPSCNKDIDAPDTGEDAVVTIDYSGSGEVIPGKYIVMFSKDAIPETQMKAASSAQERDALVRTVSDEILTANRIAIPGYDFIYGTAIRGFAASMTDEDAAKLKNDRRVAIVEPDKVIALGPPSGVGKPPPPPSGQTTPWGITRVGGGVNYTGTKKAWIIDTGVDLTHPDLNVSTTLNATFINNTTPNDQNGHGTHVAGTIAAKNNTIGVIGVAAGCQVVSVRVLNKQGSGTTSGIIAGVNYVAANAASGDVANMSLGGGVSTTLDAAVLSASYNSITGKYIWFSIAAGNSSANANNYSPARVNGDYIRTVSAMGQNDLWASFSNYGNPPIDWCAPGVSIYSTWKDGGYNTISGTSMAAPHIAGLLILKSTQTSDGIFHVANVINDPDGTPDKIGIY